MFGLPSCRNWFLDTIYSLLLHRSRLNHIDILYRIPIPWVYIVHYHISILGYQLIDIFSPVRKSPLKRKKISERNITKFCNLIGPIRRVPAIIISTYAMLIPNKQLYNKTFILDNLIGRVGMGEEK